MLVRIFDGTREAFHEDDLLKAQQWIKKQLSQWMEEGDRIDAWSTGNGGMFFQVVTEHGEPTDAHATLD